MDQQFKTAYQVLITYSENFITGGLNKDKLSAYDIKTIENEFFAYWKGAINIDVELFWDALEQQKLPYTRQSPIKKLLEKGRFKRIEQWFDLGNNFAELQQHSSFRKLFTKEEIKQISELMAAAEKKRFEFVNRCFEKRNVPPSQHGKFWESLAFLKNCNLVSEYYNKQEREVFYAWIESLKP